MNTRNWMSRGNASAAVAVHCTGTATSVPDTLVGLGPHLRGCLCFTAMCDWMAPHQYDTFFDISMSSTERALIGMSVPLSGIIGTLTVIIGATFVDISVMMPSWAQVERLATRSKSLAINDYFHYVLSEPHCDRVPGMERHNRPRPRQL